MVATKKDQYSENQLDSARIGKAIAAPARVAILQHINEHTAATNKDLSAVLLLSEATVYQHLQVLVKTGFLEGNFFGDTHAYFFKSGAQSDLDKIDWLLTKRH
ncbi:Helix-turn-helix domain protein [compost metagenome]